MIFALSLRALSIVWPALPAALAAAQTAQAGQSAAQGCGDQLRGFRLFHAATLDRLPQRVTRTHGGFVRPKGETMTIRDGIMIAVLWRCRQFDSTDIAEALRVEEADVLRVVDAMRRTDDGGAGVRV